MEPKSLVGVELAIVVGKRVVAAGAIDGAGNVEFELPETIPADRELPVVIKEVPRRRPVPVLVRGLVVDRVRVTIAADDQPTGVSDDS